MEALPTERATAEGVTMEAPVRTKQHKNGHAAVDQAEIERVFRLQQAQRAVLRPATAKERVARLKDLRRVLLRRRTAVQAAVYADFRKPPEEVDLTEIGVVLSEIKHTAQHLAAWMKPRRVETLLPFAGASSEVVVEPKGAALIIAPWNYPVMLTLMPLVSAVAAGCPAILKPSEYTPHTTRLLKDLLAECFDEREVAVVEGGAETAQSLLALPFDHVYFTGSPAVGKIVMKAAAEHLASVTLELGGKSPAFVDAQADLDDAARKLVWGKFANAGQTCVAPDYVLVDAAVHDALLVKMRQEVEAFYGTTEPERRRTPDFARIISDRHFDHLNALLDDAVADGATMTVGGTTDAAERYIAPTLLADVRLSSAIMDKEIFGPILPILRYHTLEEALKVVQQRPNPLALYIFSEDKGYVERVMGATTAGSTGVNETLLQFANPALPFGGAGHSGIGRGHGEAGFLAFSNERAVMARKVGSAVWAKLHPPYTLTTRKLIDAFLKYF